MSGAEVYFQELEKLELSDTKLGEATHPELAALIPVRGDGNCLYRAIITSMLWRGLLSRSEDEILKINTFFLELHSKYGFIGPQQLVNKPRFYINNNDLEQSGSSNTTAEKILSFQKQYSNTATSQDATIFLNFANLTTPSKSFKPDPVNDAVINYLALCMREVVFDFIRDNYASYQMFSKTRLSLDEWVAKRLEEKDFELHSWAHVDSYIDFFLQEHGFELRYFGSDDASRFTGEAPQTDTITGAAAGYASDAEKADLTPLHIVHNGTNHFEAAIKAKDFNDAFGLDLGYEDWEEARESPLPSPSSHAYEDSYLPPPPPPHDSDDEDEWEPPPSPPLISDDEDVEDEDWERLEELADEAAAAEADEDEAESEWEAEVHPESPTDEEHDVVEPEGATPAAARGPRPVDREQPAPPARPFAAQLQFFNFATIQAKLALERETIKKIFEHFQSDHPMTRTTSQASMGTLSVDSDVELPEGVDVDAFSMNAIQIRALKTACAHINNYLAELQQSGLAAAILNARRSSKDATAALEDVDHSIKQMMQSISSIRTETSALSAWFDRQGFYDEPDANQSDISNADKYGNFSDQITIHEFKPEDIAAARLAAQAFLRNEILQTIKSTASVANDSIRIQALLTEINKLLATEPKVGIPYDQQIEYTLQVALYKIGWVLLKADEEGKLSKQNIEKVKREIEKTRVAIKKDKTSLQGIKEQYLEVAEILWAKTQQLAFAPASPVSSAPSSVASSASTSGRTFLLRRRQKAGVVEPTSSPTAAADQSALELAALQETIQKANTFLVKLKKAKMSVTEKFQNIDAVLASVELVQQKAFAMLSQRSSDAQLRGVDVAEPNQRRIQLRALLVAMRAAFVAGEIEFSKIQSLFTTLQEISDNKLFNARFEDLLALRSAINEENAKTFITHGPAFLAVAAAMLQDIYSDFPDQKPLIDLLAESLQINKNAIAAQVLLAAETIVPAMTVSAPVKANVDYKQFKHVLLRHDEKSKVTLYSGSAQASVYAEAKSDNSVEVKSIIGATEPQTILKISEPPVLTADISAPKDLAVAEIIDQTQVKTSAICFVQSMVEMAKENPLPIGQRYEIVVANFNGGTSDNPLQQAEEFLRAYCYVFKDGNQDTATASVLANLEIVFSTDDAMTNVRPTTYEAVHKILARQEKAQILSDQELTFLRGRFGLERKSLRQLVRGKSGRDGESFRGVPPHKSFRGLKKKR